VLARREAYALESRVLVSARRLRDLKAAPEEVEIESIEPVERTTRAPQAPRSHLRRWREAKPLEYQNARPQRVRSPNLSSARGLLSRARLAGGTRLRAVRLAELMRFAVRGKPQPLAQPCGSSIPSDRNQQ